MPKKIDEQKEIPNFLYIPALGFSATSLIYFFAIVIKASHSHQIIITLIAVLMLYGCYKSGIHACRRKVSLVLTACGASALITSWPFVFHLAPPDVDAAAYGFFAFLIKSGQLPPVISPWGADFSTKFLVPPTGFGHLTALLSEYTGLDLAISLLVLACSCVAMILLLGVWLARDILLYTRAPIWLLWCSFPLIFNRAFIWEYGDGSYNRIPATLLMMACAVLVSILHQGNKYRVAFLIGVAGTLIWYFHYRFFIWNASILTVWFLVRAYSERHLDIKFMAFALSGLILTLIPYSLLYHDVIPSVISFDGKGALIDTKHAMSVQALFENFLRFHGHVILPLYILSLYFVVKNWRNASSTLHYGVISLLVMGFYSWDSLVLTVFPFTYNFLYSQVAILFNNSIPKIVLGVYLLSILYKFINDKFKFANSRTYLANWLLAILVFLIVIVAYQTVLKIFVTPPLLSLYSNLLLSILFISSALFFVIQAWRNRYESRDRFVKLVIFSLMATYASNEYSEARFNYPYLTPGQREAFVWLKENTPVEGTLVLTQSLFEIDPQVERENFDTGSKPNRMSYFSFSHYWLPLISERYSVFNRGVWLDRQLNTTIYRSGTDPNLNDLDWAYFHLDTEKACEIIKKFGISHVYFEESARTKFNSKIQSSKCLKLAFESKNMTSIDPFRSIRASHGASIYYVPKD
ncbi:hypothetical protein [Vibrio coralliilyticus]|uniref:hypothetical protein n=1 Tax=Vibrio coralliilyticus TaxID=190893 RepID=UPI0018055409|nr:hypothetical protein [Vibrio coralliilyticus]NUW66081.1 hypothetical protein [Vibrio coralliilyticus]